MLCGDMDMLMSMQMRCSRHVTHLFPSVYRCEAMTSALQALSGVSVISAGSNRLDLQLTSDVAGDQTAEPICHCCLTL